MNYLTKLKLTPVFQNMPDEAIVQILQSGHCRFKNYNRGMTLSGFYPEIASGGVILEGKADIFSLSIQGHETMINRLEAGDIWGLATVFGGGDKRWNIRCVTDVQVMFLDLESITGAGGLTEEMKGILLKNLLAVLSASYLELNARVEVLGQKTLKDKLMIYFERLSEKKSSRKFTISFNREELACFLAAERSSISRQLSNLSKEGGIRITGKQVELLEREENGWQAK